MGISDKGSDRPGGYLVTPKDPDARDHLVERVTLRPRANVGGENAVRTSVGREAMQILDDNESAIGNFSSALTQLLLYKNEPADLHRFFREQKQLYGDAFLLAVCARFAWKRIDSQIASLHSVNEPDVLFYMVPNFVHLNSDLPEMEVVGVRRLGEKAVVKFRRRLPLTVALSALKTKV